MGKPTSWLRYMGYGKNYLIYYAGKCLGFPKMSYYRLVLGSVGINLMLSSGVKIRVPGNLFLGSHVSMNNDVWINASGGVHIDDYVIMGPKVVIHSANHRFDRTDIPIQKQGHVMKPVHIEADVWIGAAAIILPGVRVGKGSVIGAGAVVTQDIPPYSIAVGVPAIVRSNRKPVVPIESPGHAPASRDTEAA